MSTYRLNKLFAPRSIALVGASPRSNSVGAAVLRNLRTSRFTGPIHVVNPKYDSIEGVSTVSNFDDLEEAPDLAIFTTPPGSVPSVVASAAKRGTSAGIIITGGLGHGPGSLAEQANEAARRQGMRLLGPNCLGVLCPRERLNASFAANAPLAGDLALLSQSGGVAAGLIGWAATRKVGFSAVVSCGEQSDIDLSDLLDYFALDRETRAILLYIESIKNARKFMSAARAAALLKPVLVLKSGRHREGARAAATHTGALAGSDDVYDAAFRRAGLVRVRDLSELFDASETLAKVKSTGGDRLSILTNGGGIGVLAVDRLIDLGGHPAKFSDRTFERLNAALPSTWSNSNPADIIGDADAERHAKALEILLADENSDAVLVLNVETALGRAEDTAKAVCKTVTAHRARSFPPKPVFAVWVGADAKTERVFTEANVPHYATEADAIQGFMHLVKYQQAKRTLSETPPDASHLKADYAAARRVIDAAVGAVRGWLDPVQVASVLQAYDIPALPVSKATNPADAAQVASAFLTQGQAVAVKILSPDISHKSDVSGVQLNLTSAPAVEEATRQILAAAQRARPDARLIGVTVHPMIVRPHAREVFAGIADDPTFGPIVAFGSGGTAVEIVNDKALALPPLDMNAAERLIHQTRVAKMLNAYRNVPAAQIDRLTALLVGLSRLSADFPEIREIDLNPILADENGIAVLDARISVAKPDRPGPGNHRFAIVPYPREWERRIETVGGLRTLVRPVRAEDEPLFQIFLQGISPADLRLRFFAPIKEFGHDFLARLTQIDYDRAMAFVAIDEATGELLGVARLHLDSERERGEYAVLVRSDLKGRGLGMSMMKVLIDYARKQSLLFVDGQVLWENVTMLGMCRELGFQIETDRDDPHLARVSLRIDAGKRNS